jgi:hypothetical protein
MSVWSILKALPEALSIVTTLLQKASVQETKEILREHEKRIRELDIDHDEDPVRTTRNFFSGGMRDADSTE